jgi:hypothetical protein
MACGPGSYEKRIISREPLGKNWAKVVEDSVMEESTRLAGNEFKARKQATNGPVTVRIPVTVYVSFPQGEGTSPGEGTVMAVCTFSQDETGSVCKCVGQGADTCSCSDGGSGPPIVVYVHLPEMSAARGRDGLGLTNCP